MKKVTNIVFAAAPVAALTVMMTSTTGAGPGPQNFSIRDQCEPNSFNAAVGPGTCVGRGQTTFDQFIAELTEEQSVGSWRFNPLSVGMTGGQMSTLTNRGGEVHTFTKVAEFAGGFIPILNDLSGTPVAAPECADLVAGNLIPKPPSATNIFIAAGQTVQGLTAGAQLPRGTHKFQCCIHPWMKSTVVVR